MREKGTLTRLRVRHNCQLSLKPAQEHLIGSSTQNLTVFVFWLHSEKLTVCVKNSWSVRLCFLTVTPFYEPITEVILLTCYLRGCTVITFSNNLYPDQARQNTNLDQSVTLQYSYCDVNKLENAWAQSRDNPNFFAWAEQMLRPACVSTYSWGAASDRSLQC